MSDSLKEGLEKKDYELAFLVKDEGATGDLKGIVRQHEVEIQSESLLKKINLAYKIDGVHEAYFGFLRLQALPAAMQSLARDLKTSQAFVRFLVVSLPKGNKVMSSSLGRPQRPPLRRAPLAKEIPQSKPLSSEPISNEALEKKIEEILQ